MSKNTEKILNVNPLKKALNKCNFAFKITFWFAFVINLLMLITPLYSLQVLDRVIGSGNLHTLLMLSLIIASIYFVHALLQIARSFTFIKIGEWLDNEISPIIFSNAVSASAMRGRINSSQMLRDFQTVKTFLTSAGINTLFDAPWSILYIAVVFFINKYLGYLCVSGAVIIVLFGLFNAVATNKTLGEATEYSIKGMYHADIASRNAETVESMGMIKNISKHWAKFNKGALQKQSIASYRNGVLSNFSRFIRSLLQMAVTGIGAYVVVSSNGQDMTTGNMIASSIIVGKALAPFDNAIVMWKTISSSLKSYKQLNLFFDTHKMKEDFMSINDVQGKLSLDNVFFSFDQNKNSLAGMLQNTVPKYVLQGVSFSIEPGEALAVIGNSAAGKSTLAKLICGIWQPYSGTARLDGADVFQWNRENLGTHLGYLPQNIELFHGTVKENISRMEDSPDSDEIIRVSKICGAHDMILSLSEGYDTNIGAGGSNLSGGQRQRIGLARAFYGKPKLIVLDEPNANLDQIGEEALANAILEAKKLQITVVIISHRKSILSVVDKIMILDRGYVMKFASKSEFGNSSAISSNNVLPINH
ncbi:MAG: type I secretion system permease/ATPase [Rickettsia sp.]|nr:type I secretion system permease/ATPase [Rickettsia sp.]